MKLNNLMQLTVLKISRMILWSIFLAASVGFVYYAGWSYVQDYAWIKGKGIGLSVLADEASENLMIGAGNEEAEMGQIETDVKKADARPEIIRRYLQKYKSPMADQADLIFEVSETYGFDYYWIVAIAQQESNLCKKIPENSHNCWGYGIHKKGTLRFENYELAIRSFAEYLKREYFDKGLNTPELIMKKYCPSSNGSWARGVQQFIDEMESGSFDT